MQSVERHPDVSGCHPVLQHGAVVEVVGRRTTFQRAEGDAGSTVGVDVTVCVRTESLLLVGLGDLAPRRPAVHLVALTRVVLERDPRLAEVDALVDGHGVGPHGTELKTDVGQLVALAQTQRESHVAWSSHERLRYPAGQVVRVVQVSQVSGRVTPLRVIRVTDLARSERLARSPWIGRGLADTTRRGAAGAGCGDLAFQRSVHEVRDAATRPTLFVGARVGRRVLRHKYTEEGGRSGHRHDTRGGVQEKRSPHCR